MKALYNSVLLSWDELRILAFSRKVASTVCIKLFSVSFIIFNKRSVLSAFISGLLFPATTYPTVSEDIQSDIFYCKSDLTALERANARAVLICSVIYPIVQGHHATILQIKMRTRTMTIQMMIVAPLYTYLKQ